MSDSIVIIQADVFEGLARLPDESVNCVVTSVPYWGLRSYLPEGHPDKRLEIGQRIEPRNGMRDTSLACGAVGAQGLADAQPLGRRSRRTAAAGEAAPGRSSGEPSGRGDHAEGLGDTASAGSQGQWREYRPRGERHRGLAGFAMQAGVPQWNGSTIAVLCSDGSRRVCAEPDTFPLAIGVKNRMGKLRAYGNAINPHLAAEFIKAAWECRP